APCVAMASKLHHLRASVRDELGGGRGSERERRQRQLVEARRRRVAAELVGTAQQRNGRQPRRPRGIELGRAVREERELLWLALEGRCDRAIGGRVRLAAAAGVEPARDEAGQIAGAGVTKEGPLRAHRARRVNVEREPPVTEARERGRYFGIDVRDEGAALEGL